MKLNSGNLTPAIGIIRQGTSKKGEVSVDLSPLEIAENFLSAFYASISSCSIDLKSLVKTLPHLNLKKNIHWNFRIDADTPNYIINKGWAWMLGCRVSEDNAWEILLWTNCLGKLTGEWERFHLILNESSLKEIRLRSASGALVGDIMDKARAEWKNIRIIAIDGQVRISLLCWEDGVGLQRVTFLVRTKYRNCAVEVFGKVMI